MNDQKDRLLASFVGLAVGDALGTSVEFKKRGTFEPITDMRGGGCFRLKPGEWTDDTSMALCLAHSLIECGEFNQKDIMDKFLSWYYDGHYSHNGVCFDIGNMTRRALVFFKKTGKLISLSSLDNNSSGNGSIMRLAPIVLFYHNVYDTVISMAEQQSKLTHPSIECIESCKVLADTIYKLSTGLKLNNITNIIDINHWKNIPAEKISSTGYVIDTMNAAYWAVSNTNNFKDALLMAVNLGGDADTIGAVTGQIAGALYGFCSIPKDWLSKLAWGDKIINLGEKLLNFVRTK